MARSLVETGFGIHAVGTAYRARAGPTLER
jgi:hypothetical protein